MIRIIAILGVVLIHAIYPIYSRPDFQGGTTWWLALFLNTISHVAIPLFIMLSGYLVLNKDESSSQTWQRTWKRLLLPFIAWFALYVIWDAQFLSKHHSFIDLLSMTLMSNVYHLYFLIILAGLYLLLPLWRFVVKTNQTYMWLLIKLSFGFGFIYYLLQYVMFPSVNVFNSVTIWIPFLGYFLLGHAFTSKKLWSTRKSLILFMVGFLATLGGSYLNFLLLKDSDTFLWRNGVSYFEEPLSINGILMSVSLFQLLIHNAWLEKSITKFKLIGLGIKELAASSFAVYLVHFMVINYLDLRKNFALEFLTGDLLSYFVIRTSLVVVCSFAVGSLLIRIPLVKKVVGL